MSDTGTVCDKLHLGVQFINLIHYNSEGNIKLQLIERLHIQISLYVVYCYRLNHSTVYKSRAVIFQAKSQTRTQLHGYDDLLLFSIM